MTNPTDPAAVEAWGDAAAIHIAMTGSLFSERQEAATRVIQSYGDQREAAARADERERCVAWLRNSARMNEYSGLMVTANTQRQAASAIERGDHLKGSGDDL